MRKHMIESTASDVAAQVRTVEDTIDAALTEIAELQARIVRARAVVGVGVLTGHEALEQLCQATTALVTARGGIGHCHKALAQARQAVPGLRSTTAIGDGDECPPPKAAAPLRIVA